MFGLGSWFGLLIDDAALLRISGWVCGARSAAGGAGPARPRGFGGKARLLLGTALWTAHHGWKLLGDGACSQGLSFLLSRRSRSED